MSTTCPSWCAVPAETHAADMAGRVIGGTFHTRTTSAPGAVVPVEVSAFEPDDQFIAQGGQGNTLVLIEDCPQELTGDQAAQLGRALLDAAALLSASAAVTAEGVPA